MGCSSYPQLTSVIVTNQTFIDKKGTEAVIIQAD